MSEKKFRGGSRKMGKALELLISIDSINNFYDAPLADAIIALRDAQGLWLDALMQIEEAHQEWKEYGERQ